MSSTKLKPIILYDIPCTTPRRPWSPNTMKTRYCLGYKHLPFTTVWVELPDIAGLFQSKDITQPPYTLPAIEDTNTGKFIVDSLTIAAYLDDEYPETPRVLSPAARAALEGVGNIFSFGSGGGAVVGMPVGVETNTSISTSGAGSALAPRLVFLILAAERLNPVSKVYYHQTRAARLGGVWTALRDACSASLEDRAEHVGQGVDAFREEWHRVTAMYDHGGESEGGGSRGPFMLGDEPCFLDFAVAGRVKFILDGLVPSEVETVMNLERGMLGRLVENLERYYKH